MANEICEGGVCHHSPVQLQPACCLHVLFRRRGQLSFLFLLSRFKDRHANCPYFARGGDNVGPLYFGENGIIVIRGAFTMFFGKTREGGKSRPSSAAVAFPKSPPPCFHANPFGKRLDWLGALSLFCPLFWLPGTRRSPKLCRIDRRGL